MDDTPLEISQLQARIWRAKPFAERMRIGSAADADGLEAAAILAARKSPNDAAALFLCLHAEAFEPDVLERIARAIRARHESRSKVSG